MYYDNSKELERITELEEQYADAQRALDAERARVKELQGAASTPINELLAELISCAGVFDVSTDYEDDRKALETATQAVLDHVATLQAQLADRDAMILQMGEQAAVLAKENMAVKAQLRQVEGQSQQQAEEAVIVFAKYTTLQQLVEALINSDTAKDHDKAWFALRATLAAQDAPLTKEQRRIEDCCEKPHDCKWGGIGGCGYEGRKYELKQDAGTAVSSG